MIKWLTTPRLSLLDCVAIGSMVGLSSSDHPVLAIMVTMGFFALISYLEIRQ